MIAMTEEPRAQPAHAGLLGTRFCQCGEPWPIVARLGWVTAAITALCGDVLSAQPPNPVIRDSAGVRIVEYASVSGSLPQIAVAGKSFLDLGGLKGNPDEEFDAGHPMLGATRLSDGRLVVTDMARLMFFSPTGSFLTSAGRRGRGPGEFTQLGKVCRLRGDSLLAIDWSERRLSLWDSAGKLVRAFSRPGEVALTSCFSDGSVIIPDFGDGGGAVPASPSAIGLSDRTIEYIRIRPDGSVIRTLGRHPRSEVVGGAVVHRQHRDHAFRILRG
jgi:hypothetical protein